MRWHWRRRWRRWWSRWRTRWRWGRWWTRWRIRWRWAGRRWAGRQSCSARHYMEEKHGEGRCSSRRVSPLSCMKTSHHSSLASSSAPCLWGSIRPHLRRSALGCSTGLLMTQDSRRGCPAVAVVSLVLQHQHFLGTHSAPLCVFCCACVGQI